MASDNEADRGEEPCRPNGFGLCMTHPTCDHVKVSLEEANAKIRFLSRESYKPIPCADEQLRGIMARLKEEGHYDRWHHSDDNPLGLLVSTLDHKRAAVTGAIARGREFQQDVLTFLRAFSLMLGTVAGASTHGEKAARLRGLIELVETAAVKLREKQFRDESTWSYALADDVFRCDYPVRHWIDRTREAEAKAERAEQELAKVRELWAPKPSVETPPMTSEDRKNVPF